MKKFLVTTLFAVMTGLSGAQPVTYDSVKIADTAVNAVWESLSPLLTGMTQKLESDLKSGGATARAANVLAREATSSLTKDNFSKAIAFLIAEKLTSEEQAQVLTFMQSTAGRKYLELSKPGEAQQRAIAAILKQSCDAASTQLSAFDKASINGACSQYR